MGDPQLPEEATEGTDSEERAATWAAMTARLAPKLDELLASHTYGPGAGGRPAPQDHGVYLFSEAGRHLYVGRTGRTERSRRSGRQSSSGFRARLNGHCSPAAGISSATFAIRLAREAAAAENLEIPAQRNQLLQHMRFAELFGDAKRRIARMEFRVTAITDDHECTVFEVYCAFVLATPYNSFATS